MIAFMKQLFLILTLILMGCSPANTQDCQREAAGIMRSLAASLKKVQTREDLIGQGHKIKKEMNKLVQIMVRIKKLQEKSGPVLVEADRAASDLLLLEMKRIYKIEGIRELMETYQREALLELDAFDQSRRK